MTDTSDQVIETFDPETMLKVLAEHAVEFVVIGGYASQLYGGVFPTRDLDVVPRTTDENLVRLHKALVELGARVRLDATGVVTTELPSDPKALTAQQIMTLVTRFGRLDLVIDPGGYRGDYEDIVPRVEKMRSRSGLLIAVVGLDDLITSKAAMQREKDIASLNELERIRSRMTGDIP